jgi:hypothetical protein
MRLETFGTLSNSALSVGAGALTQSSDYSYLALPVAEASGIFWLIILAVFLYRSRKEIRAGAARLGSWYFILPCLVVTVIAIAGAAYGIGLRSATSEHTPDTTAKGTPPQDQLTAAAPQVGSVLVSARYYSAKNKEEVAAFLDQISNAINKTADQMLVLAQQALNDSPWDRPGENIEPFVKRMDDILALSVKMHIALYDELLAKEREYRVEMNSILFPKEPFTDFQNGANEFRNGLAVWMAMNGSVPNADRHGLFRLVNASRMTFGYARDKFLAWINQRQELIGQTRRALRS